MFSADTVLVSAPESQSGIFLAEPKSPVSAFEERNYGTASSNLCVQTGNFPTTAFKKMFKRS